MAEDIAAELQLFVTDAGKPFDKAYSKITGKEISKFLNARMDQVRIYHALKASKALLDTVGFTEAFIFQDVVLRRERSREIAYHSQRDHTCHTLNNFILGWYIYQNNAGLKKSFSQAFAKRGLGVGKSDDVKFAAIWIYVSLLHDIGYIFEGDFSKPSAFENDKSVKKAIKCIRDFFGNGFWTNNLLNSADRDCLIDEGLIHKFDISAASMQDLSDRLQFLGNLKPLLEEAGRGFPKAVIKTDVNNAFDLWSKNYAFFANKKMSDKINQLRSDFQTLRTRGIAKDGPKILNHAVCSGLILLQCTTYYYQLYSAIASLKKANKLPDIVGRFDLKQRSYSIDLWWSGLVWATAAVAIHDRYHALINKNGRDKLSFSDDPLAFLGILVDEMQLWDRFRVFDPTQGHKFEDIPTQSSDVGLTVFGGKVMFSAPRHEIENLEKSLDERLADWREVVFLKAVN